MAGLKLRSWGSGGMSRKQDRIQGVLGWVLEYNEEPRELREGSD